MKPLAAVLIAISVRCSHGREFSYADTKKLRPGVSTRADAEAIFGPPASVTANDGNLVLRWDYAKAGFLGLSASTKTLLITFTDGIFQSATETESKD